MKIITILLLACAAPLLAQGPPKGPPKGKSSDGTSGKNNDVGRAIRGGFRKATQDVNDPVDMSSGAFHFTHTWLDLGQPTGGLPLVFGLHYASDNAPNFTDSLPPNFLSNHHNIIIQEARDADGRNHATFHGPFGSQLTFRETAEDSGQWFFFDNESTQHQLHETTDFFYFVDPQNELIFCFEKAPEVANVTRAFLRRISNRNDQHLTYTSDVNEQLQSITDSQGRTLNFAYTNIGGSDFLTGISDHTTRNVTLTYEENPADNPGLVTLRKITDAASGETVFSYDKNHRITGITMPEGNIPVTQTYPADETIGAALTQTDAAGRTFTYEETDPIPGLGDTHFLLTNPDGSEEHYHHTNNGTLMSALTDALGHTMKWKADTGNRNRIVEITDRDGHTVKLTYHDPSGKVASITDENGHLTTHTYTNVIQNFSHPADPESITAIFFHLTRITHPDSSTHTATFDAKGNPLTLTDRAGDTTTITYDSNGRPLTITNPQGGITTLTYNVNGKLATATNSDTGLTTFAYDSLHRLITRTRPDATTRTYTYDALDRPTSVTNEENHTTACTYDANSNLLTRTRASGTPIAQTTTYTYNNLDRLITATNPNGDTTTLTYDYHPGVKTITLPDGSTIHRNYDARRSLVSITNPIGGITRFDRQPSELLKTLTTPEGRATTLDRDPEGLVQKITDPSGDTSSLTRDPLDRVTKTTDPLNRSSQVTRDPDGRITALTEPTTGTSTRQYDGNNRLTQLTDTRGDSWNFTFTNMGRRQSITDPTGNSETRTYDTRGRLKTITHPDAVSETRAYHPDSRLATRTYSDGLTHTFTYDQLNRLTQTQRTLGAQTDTATYTRDSRNNLLTHTTNGETAIATFDNRSRLKTLTYPGGMIVTYIYDARGLCTRIEENLTNSSLDLEYNADGQIIKTTRSNGRVTDTTYDAEGLPEKLQHDTGATLNITFNPADEPVRIQKTDFPADGSAALIATTDTFTYNQNSEITNTGLTYDEKGRPNNATWDANNRLTQINGITYRYDALGKITSRSEGGTTTKYLYHAALRTAPIIGEKQGATYTRFYLALPNGHIVAHIEDPQGTPPIRIHHHGQTGNTRFLTDAAGTITDAYAYDAYGRTLEKTGSSQQIYRYVGRLGVRTDDPAGC